MQPIDNIGHIQIDNPQKIDLPPVCLVKQQLYQTLNRDLDKMLDTAFNDFSISSFSKSIKPGQSVAVAIGSRGIRHIDRIVSVCIKHLKQIGLMPFIVPAMGSHGGGTSQGQKSILADLKISPETMGVPVDAALEVADIGQLPDGLMIRMAQSALKADHIVLINRIKPHTKFKAPIESGLCKMLTIGLGKVTGAKTFHRHAVNHGFGVIEQAAQFILNTCPVLFGVALVEDGFGDIDQIDVILPDRLIQTEKKLLKKATQQMALIPFDDIDVLVVDNIGKNISGIGMDSNVTGRHRDIVGDFNTSPHVKRIYVRDLSDHSDGNANGIGLADFTSSRLVAKMDRQKTMVNALAAISPEKASIPIHFDTDRQAMDACLKTCGLEDPKSARIIRIKDTKTLEYFIISAALANELSTHPTVEQITPLNPMDFDPDDNLLPFYPSKR